MSELDKLREELERSQATLGKSQLQQDKLQNQYDKVQSEFDQLQERYDKLIADMRRVGLLFHFFNFTLFSTKNKYLSLMVIDFPFISVWWCQESVVTVGCHVLWVDKG